MNTKQLLLTVTLTFACVAVFAQGKILFGNDSLHAVYFSSYSCGLLPGDIPTSAVPLSGADARGYSLSVDLWYGASPSTLCKLATTTMAGGTIAGVFAPVQAIVPQANTEYYFQVQVYSTFAGSFAAARANYYNAYWGESEIFTCTGGSFAPTPLYGPRGSWADGTVPVTGSVAGAMGAIPIWVVPEPTSLALFGLGGGVAWMSLRRRK